MTGIYKIISPSGKVYIGQSVDIERRFLNYKYIQCIQQPKLYNSLKKYGSENHKFEIIEECEQELLDNKEEYWIKFYDSIKKGLNIQSAKSTKIFKEKTKRFNEDWCRKISESKKGKSTENTKKTIIQYDLEGNFIREFESQKEASRVLNISNSGINNALKGVSAISGNFKWKYKSS